MCAIVTDGTPRSIRGLPTTPHGVGFFFSFSFSFSFFFFLFSFFFFLFFFQCYTTLCRAMAYNSSCVACAGRSVLSILHCVPAACSCLQRAGCTMQCQASASWQLVCCMLCLLQPSTATGAVVTAWYTRPTAALTARILSGSEGSASLS